MNDSTESKKRYPMEPTDASFYEVAPARFDNYIDIPVSAATVWKILEDGPSWSRWAGVIDDVEWTSPRPFGLGTTRTVIMANGMMTGWEKFIAWDAGKRMGFCFTEATMDGIARFAEDWHVTDTGTGSCRVRWIMCMEPKGINKYIIRAFAPIMRLNFRSYLKSLRKYCIQQASNPQFNS